MHVILFVRHYNCFTGVLMIINDTVQQLKRVL